MNKTPYINVAFRVTNQAIAKMAAYRNHLQPNYPQYSPYQNQQVPHGWGSEQGQVANQFIHQHPFPPQAPMFQVGQNVNPIYQNARSLFAFMGVGATGVGTITSYWDESNPENIKAYLKRQLIYMNHTESANQPVYSVVYFSYGNCPEPLVLINKSEDFGQALINTARLYDVHCDKGELSILGVRFFTEQRLGMKVGPYNEGVLVFADLISKAPIESSVVALQVPGTSQFSGEYRKFTDTLSVSLLTGSSFVFAAHVAEASMDQANPTGKLEPHLTPYARSLESILDQIRNLGTDCEEDEEDEETLYQELVALVKAKVQCVYQTQEAVQTNDSLDTLFNRK